MIEERTVFKVGDIPIQGDLVAAPMDGISDSAFRSLLRRHGASLCYTEFINAQDVLHDSILYERKAMLVREEEHPIGFQLYDNEPDNIVAASLKLLRYEPDFIDINIGCSVSRVSGRGAGAGLLLEPHKIIEIFDRLSNTLKIPVTAKIRLGWDEHNYNFLEIASLIEKHGGAMIAVHGRTRQQGFQGQANWDAIRQIKEELNIPVIGNGDVTCVEDIQHMKAITNCDAVMIGRAAIANPWLFERRDRDEVSAQEVFELIQEQLALMLLDYEEEITLILFRKYLNQYLTPLALTREAKVQLFNITSAQALLKELQLLLGL